MKYDVNFFLEGFNSSGGIRILTNLANYISQKNFQVKITVPSYNSTPFYSVTSSVNIQIIRCGNSKLKKLIYLFNFIVYAARNSKIVVASGYKTPLFIYLSKIINFSSINIVYIIQSNEAETMALYNNHNRFTNTCIKSIAKLGYLLPSQKICVSNYVKSKTRTINSLVINNSIDTNYFKNIIPWELRLENSYGIFYSKDKIKGFSVFLDTLKILDNLFKYNFIIASKDEFPNISTPNLKFIKINTNDDIINFYNSCQYFIFPSLEEGFGLPPLEAMSCGCIVLSSKCGGVLDYLNSDNSYLFTPDSPSSLSSIIQQSFLDTDNYKILFHMSETIKKQSMKSMLENYFIVFKKIM